AARLHGRSPPIASAHRRDLTERFAAELHPVPGAPVQGRTRDAAHMGPGDDGGAQAARSAMRRLPRAARPAPPPPTLAPGFDGSEGVREGEALLLLGRQRSATRETLHPSPGKDPLARGYELGGPPAAPASVVRVRPTSSISGPRRTRRFDEARRSRSAFAEKARAPAAGGCRGRRAAAADRRRGMAAP